MTNPQQRSDDLFGAVPDTGPSSYTLQQQIACVNRELSFRERCYPRWIKEGTMTRESAQFELGCMMQVLRTLRSMINDGK